MPKIEKASSEFDEWSKQMKEESQKFVTGLFNTELDIKQEGNGVKLDFFLHNIFGEDLEFYFRSNQKFDIFVINQHGGEVYRLPQKTLPAQVDVTLNKNEKLSFSEVWDYKNNKGNRVPPRKYSIKVILLAKLENGRIISPDALTAVKDIEID
ncbi:MAG: hypothetical protein GX257_07900 [Clostridiales bacterium]|nr:hypothetical protein [Clostridiales bacterium]